MGCGVSRLDENGMVIPIKARPLFFLRLEEYRKRRHLHAVKGPSPSKKELLLDDKGEDDHNVARLGRKDGKESSFLPEDTGSCVTSEGSKGESLESKGCNNGAKANDEVKSLKKDRGEEHNHEGRQIEPLSKYNHIHEVHKFEHNMDGDVKIEDEDDDDEVEEEDGGRMIGHHEDDLAFPGSPSFRVYFTDVNKGVNESEDFVDNLTRKAPSPRPLKVPMNEEVKKQKRRNFKKVLPTGKHAKNIFHVRARVPSTPSTHYHAHLLTAKAHA